MCVCKGPSMNLTPASNERIAVCANCPGMPLATLEANCYAIALHDKIVYAALKYVLTFYTKSSCVGICDSMRALCSRCSEPTTGY